MDERYRLLRREALDGDVEAALGLERSRTRQGFVRERDRQFPQYSAEISQRYIRGPVTIIPRGVRRIEIVASQESPLYVNRIPYRLEYDFYYFTEEDGLMDSSYDSSNHITGWLPTSPREIRRSQNERASSWWSLGGFLGGSYSDDDLFGRPETIFRVTGNAFPQYILPTPKARSRITDTLTALIPEWMQDHPKEIELAQAMFLNNRIIEDNGVVDQLLEELHRAQLQLGSLLIEELRYRE